MNPPFGCSSHEDWTSGVWMLIVQDIEWSYSFDMSTCEVLVI
jgi:hypothetical protein